jgi:serine/threonine protein kinase/class 3 adenylate cyclase
MSFTGIMMPYPGTEHFKLAAILFTDVVGSTQLKAELGDREAGTLIRRHHALIREVLGGFQEAEEINTAGDSFLILFAKPSDAVKFALLVQSKLRALAKESRAIRDRIGIHVGEIAIEGPSGSGRPKDLSGIHVDICARVMGLAQGDQILMTRFAFDSARSVLRGEELQGLKPLRWLNHGPYLLKGVEEPLEICEVGETGAGPLTPPPTSEKAHRHAAADQEPVLGWRPALEQVVPNTQWVLERKLGEGGFGEVWLGRHETLKERRVFKFCFRADRVRSLKREVTLFRLLKERVGHHPNIVGIQEVFFDAPPFYLMMDYAAGLDLRSWCEASGGVEKIPLETRLEIVAQVADALQAAHEAGVIHRDVKPSNILIAEFGVRNAESEPGVLELPDSRTGSGTNPKSEIRNPKLLVRLTDFGIGQVISEEYLAGVTRAGFTQTMMSPGSSAQMGTQMYLAPELLAGKPASPRSDLYSLGVVLYQLLVGDFGHPLTTDWAEAIIDPLLREDLVKCFAGKPEERFASVKLLAASLRAWEMRRAERGARERTARRQRKFKRAAVAFAASVALVVLLFVAGRFTGPRGPAAPPTPNTVAVIHFRNDSLHPSDEHLGDSLTTEVIARIRKAPGLNAVRPPAFLLARPAAEMRLVFAQANWPLELDGTIQRVGDRINIVARLIRSTDGSELASTNYDRPPGHLLGIPNDLALRVVEQAGVRLTAEARRRIEKLPTPNPEAYELDLRGRFDAVRLGGRARFEESRCIETLQRAVDLDPNFAVAFADLASAYVRHYFYFRPELTAELEPKALAAIQRALEIDPQSAEADFAAALYHWTPSQRWQHGKAIKAYRSALAKSPFWEEASEQLAVIYMHVGLLDEGRLLAAKILQNNPLSWLARSHLATVSFWQGKDSEAVEVWRDLVAQSSLGFIQNAYFAVSLLNLGQTNEAAVRISAGLKNDPQDIGGVYASVQAIRWAKAGNEAEATNQIAKALAIGQGFGHAHHAVYNVALAYALLNKTTPAVRYLREVANDGFPCYPLFDTDSNLKNIRRQAEFQGFLAEQKVQHERFQREFGEPTADNRR